MNRQRAQGITIFEAGETPGAKGSWGLGAGMAQLAIDGSTLVVFRDERKLVPMILGGVFSTRVCESFTRYIGSVEHRLLESTISPKNLLDSFYIFYLEERRVQSEADGIESREGPGDSRHG